MSGAGKAWLLYPSRAVPDTPGPLVKPGLAADSRNTAIDTEAESLQVAKIEPGFL